MRDEEVYKVVQVAWRKLCRDVSFQEELHPNLTLTLTQCYEGSDTACK